MPADIADDLAHMGIIRVGKFGCGLGEDGHYAAAAGMSDALRGQPVAPLPADLAARLGLQPALELGGGHVDSLIEIAADLALVHGAQMRMSRSQSRRPKG
jgi:hypothetical protein